MAVKDAAVLQDSFENIDKNFILIVRVFYKSNDLLYRQVRSKKTLKINEIQNLIPKAQGKADPRRRFYFVSKRSAYSLDSFLVEKLDWNFGKFYYQFGAVEKFGKIKPDGFFIGAKKIADGAIINYFSSSIFRNVSGLKNFFKTSQLGEFEAIYLGTQPSVGLLKFFFQEKVINSNIFYYELEPIMRLHIDYYNKKYGLALMG